MSLNEEKINYIEESIGYHFKRRSLLEQAFTRKSYAIEQRMLENEIYGNEQLEFFGDSVLNYILVKNAKKKFSVLKNGFLVSYEDEGKLTNFISHWSDKEMLSKCIDELGFSDFLILNKGDKNQNVKESMDVKEDLFEAIIGAIWIDSECDLAVVEKPILKMLNMKSFFMLEYASSINKINEWASKYSNDYNTKVMFSKIKNDSDITVNCIANFKDESFITESTNKKSKLAEKEASKKMIELLIDKNIYDLPMIKKTDYSIENAINKLQELFQKKKIGQIRYTENFDYNQSIWEVECSMQNYNQRFISINKIKLDAKKEAALKALDYLSIGIESEKFNPFDKDFVYVVYEESKTNICLDIAVVDSIHDGYIHCKTYFNDKKISFPVSNLNVDTAFKSIYDAAANYYACKNDFFSEPLYSTENIIKYIRYKEIQDMEKDKSFRFSTEIEKVNYFTRLIDKFDWEEFEKVDINKVKIWW